MLMMLFEDVMVIILMAIDFGYCYSSDFLDGFYIPLEKSVVLIFRIFLVTCFILVFFQVELAHGGRGHSSSNDRHSSYNGSSGGRGVSRRTEHRGMIFKKEIRFIEDLFKIWVFKIAFHMQFLLLVCRALLPGKT